MPPQLVGWLSQVLQRYHGSIGMTQLAESTKSAYLPTDLGKAPPIALAPANAHQA